jgi:serine/threonine protein kinase
MGLSVGARLGCYEIQSPIGAGGMGEVYRARDTKLGRDVAIKVLPASLTSDPERLARFAREAQVLAALNHPNIAGIYHVEDTTDGSAIVMELSKVRLLAIGSHADRFQSTKRCRSRSRLRKRWKPHMSRASSIAI